MQQPKKLQDRQKKRKPPALIMQNARESVTLSMAYIEARKLKWSELHYRDRVKAIQAGGEKRSRSPKLTEPGTLAALANVRLVDLSPELLNDWT